MATVDKFITLDAATAIGPGATADFGSAQTHITLHVVPAGVLAGGVVSLQVSMDGTTWVAYSNTGVLTGSFGGSIGPALEAAGSFRYARANVDVTIIGGTVSAWLMAS